MILNGIKFYNLLVSNKLPVDLVCSDEQITWSRELTAEEKAQYEQIRKSYDPVEHWLEPTQQLIIANGLHTASVRCGVKYAEPVPATDVILINGESQTIDLIDGAAELKFVSSTPGTVIKLEFHSIYAVIEAK